MKQIENELNNVVDWLNANYNQESENYNVFAGSKPDVIEYNDHVAISTWACGAIICIYDQLYFIEEDDGNWWINKEEKEYGNCAYQGGFSIGWANSFINALSNLKKYVDEYGKPVYFSGTNVVCNYRLGKSE